MPKGKRSYKSSQELKIQHVCSVLRASSSPNIRAVAAEHKVPYYTLRRRFLGKSQPYRKAYIEQRLLSPEFEAVLIDWIKLLSSIGQPLSKRTIRIKAAALLHGKWRSGSDAYLTDIRIHAQERRRLVPTISMHAG
ncbi:hypothetical protein M405DRAFT_327993 [Rhizopogon salebrosus TDB-379]|nr:hypothetical protein M405DRAFT_327993 [Rhizopogon salebrosus TDB-379]